MKKITQNLMVALTIFSSMAIISQTEVEDSTSDKDLPFIKASV